MKTWTLTVFGWLALSAFAQADPIGAAAGPEEASFVGILFSLVAGILGALGLAFAFKVYRLTRGGELSSGWQWLAGAAFFFAAAQILSFLGGAGFAPVSPATLSLLNLGAGLGIALGLGRIKKVMS
jgi:hypothetical protein